MALALSKFEREESQNLAHVLCTATTQTSRLDEQRVQLLTLQKGMHIPLRTRACALPQLSNEILMFIVHDAGGG
eukprot:570722-Amphidinium_carterae.1